MSKYTPAKFFKSFFDRLSLLIAVFLIFLISEAIFPGSISNPMRSIADGFVYTADSFLVGTIGFGIVILILYLIYKKFFK